LQSFSGLSQAEQTTRCISIASLFTLYEQFLCDKTQFAFAPRATLSRYPGRHRQCQKAAMFHDWRMFPRSFLTVARKAAINKRLLFYRILACKKSWWGN
jgi:hypothetical protein